MTAQTFSRYLSDQAAAHSEMLPVMLAGYYAWHDTWEGVQPDIDQAGAMIGAQVTLADTTGRIVAASQPDLIGRQVAEVPSLGLAIAGLAVALLAAGLGVLLARSISRPLAEMGRAAARIAQGDYAVRVPVRGRDEVTALAGAFNRMAEGMSSVERLRRELVANVSHDLRTPLTVIRGYLEGLRSGQIADRRSAEIAFEAMHAEVTRLLHLVGDLRQVAALDAGSIPLNRRPLAVSELLQETIDRVAPLAAAKEIALTTETSPDLPPVIIDPERLGQALFNLLENAVRHTPAGGAITIQCAVAGHQALVNSEQVADHWLLITITDSGEGIPAEHLPHIFERFYRVDPARSRAEDGAGLGLAIVKAIVEAHGGSVKAESDGLPGQGSTFTVSLPLFL